MRAKRKPLSEIPESAELHERNNAIIELYRGGHSLRDVARAVGLNFERVRQILLQRGEPLRPRGSRPAPAHKRSGRA